MTNDASYEEYVREQFLRRLPATSALVWLLTLVRPQVAGHAGFPRGVSS